VRWNDCFARLARHGIGDRELDHVRALVIRAKADAAGERQREQRGDPLHVLGFLRRATMVKKSGMKIVAMKVAASMPPTTPVPIERRAPAPAPVAIMSGITPSTKASEVITIGRKRSRAAFSAASTALLPSRNPCCANSTIRIAFFAARPISTTRPIWK